MASILSVTSGFGSILYPSVELARRLAAHGHQVTFAGAPQSRDLVEHHGLGFLPLEPSRYPEFLEQDAQEGILGRFRNLSRRRERARASMALEGFVRAVGELDPDLVLLDGEMHEHIMAAAGTGVPIVLLNSFASIWRQPGLPPAHCRVEPGVGFEGSRFGIWLLWQALGLRKRRSAVCQWIQRVGCDRRSILRHLARETGFDFHRETDAGHWLIPFTYRRFPVLSLHALEFEFPHRPPPRVHYVGPMLLDTRLDRPMGEEARGVLDAIFARRRCGGEHRLIYAGFGSVLTTDLSFLKRLLKVVEERPHWELVLSLSDRMAVEDLGRLPERVHAFPWVPQREVLEHADAVVTHGGINTLDECVVAGVPMLIYCGFETDMGGNTARVVHHGIGLAGDRRRDSTATIRQYLDHLLTEPRFVDNLRRLRQRYLAYAENRAAEGVIDALLASRSEREPRR